MSNSLYEINEQLLNLTDSETGEIEEREAKAVERAVKQIITFKEEKGYLLNGNVSRICQKNQAKVRPVRAKLKELGVTK